jgi:mannose-6-phosphate isomerase-like protein (cupin superfamily)
MLRRNLPLSSPCPILYDAKPRHDRPSFHGKVQAAGDLLWIGGKNMRTRISGRIRAGTLVPTLLAVGLGAGWLARESAFARSRAEMVKSATINVGEVKMDDLVYQGAVAGKAGVYISGDTPGSTKFVTGRFVLAPGKTPHAPHVHPEEEVMVVESGQGEIFCDGKTTKVGPGSVMYTTPNASHGITNTGPEPIVFYWVKWQAKGAQ